MIFNLSTMHMGDVLMALPAMREGDSVMVRARHRFPGAPVNWLLPGDVTQHGCQYPAPRRGRHQTEAWLEATQRAPFRHQLLPVAKRRGVVIAPDVVALPKQWPAERWAALREALPGARVIDHKVSRDGWMHALNTAAVVICPDTGTAHMADALGCPRVVVLHGVPANWPHCAPFWDRRYCIARDSMLAISVDDVLEVARA